MITHCYHVPQNTYDATRETAVISCTNDIQHDGQATFNTGILLEPSLRFPAFDSLFNGL